MSFLRPVPSRSAPPARLSDAPLPPYEPEEPKDGRWPGHTVGVDGTDLFVRVTPPVGDDLPPALFVHGLGGSATNWTDLAQQLRGHLDIESIDLPGFGFSGPAANGNYSPGAQAKTIIAYLEQSGRGPVHLVGNSMGGAITLRVAARRPDLVRSLTVISPAVPDVRPGRIHPLRYRPGFAAIVVPGVGTMVMRRAGHYPVETQVKATIALCFADRRRYPKQRLAEAVDDATRRKDQTWAVPAFLSATRALASSQLLHPRRTWAQIRTITVPTLVLWGDEDKLVAPDLAGFVAAAVPDSRLLVLEHIGHTAMMEDPVTTARAVLGLVEDVEEKARASA